MISILIVDDDNDKISDIISVVREKYDDLSIVVESDSFSAQRTLITNKFDVLVLDLNLPYRMNDSPNPDGGKILLQEINRNDRIKSPNFVLGLTQFPIEDNEFSDIWNVFQYDPSNSNWRDKLLQIINHAVKARRNTSVKVSKIETLFVEGKSDKRIITDALKLFYPEYLSKIIIKDSDGAPFVSRYLIIWANSLSRRDDTSFVRAVGLLDRDESGDDAKSEVNRVIVPNSAESKTFNIIQLEKKYAKHLIPIYSKGVHLPITLEELFPYEIWCYAEKENWLTQRNNLDGFLQDPKSWDKFNMSLKEYLNSLELSERELIYISKLNKDCKDDFSKYVCDLSKEQKMMAYQNIKLLLDDIVACLFR